MSFIDSIGALEFFWICFIFLVGFYLGLTTMYVGNRMIEKAVDKKFDEKEKNDVWN